MKHAILLMVHDNVSVVKTLMKILDDKRFTFYLLVDKKSPYLPSDYCPELNFSKVCILPQMKLNWGGYSLIDGILLLLETALKDNADFYHYLSGADLPLKTPNEINAFFKNDSLYVDVEQNPSAFACYKVLCKHWFVEFKSFRNSKCLRLLNHAVAHLYKPFMKFKKNYGKLYTGSALWSIPYDFAQYVLKNKMRIKKTYKRSLAADEVFIQTLIMNSDFKYSLSEYGNARLIDWKNSEGNSPKTFTLDDCEQISAAVSNSSLMFLRKIQENRDDEVANYIFNLVGMGISKL